MRILGPQARQCHSLALLCRAWTIPRTLAGRHSLPFRHAPFLATHLLAPPFLSAQGRQCESVCVIAGCLLAGTPVVCKQRSL